MNTNSKISIYKNINPRTNITNEVENISTEKVSEILTKLKDNICVNCAPLSMTPKKLNNFKQAIKWALKDISKSISKKQKNLFNAGPQKPKDLDALTLYNYLISNLPRDQLEIISKSKQVDNLNSFINNLSRESIVTNLLKQDKIYEDKNSHLKRATDILKYSGETKELDLRGHGLSAFPSKTLLAFPKVTKLHLQLNKIRNLDNLPRLDKLEELDLSGNQISTLAYVRFEEFPKLKILYLARNPLLSYEEFRGLNNKLEPLISLNKDTFNGLKSIEKILFEYDDSLSEKQREYFNIQLTNNKMVIKYTWKHNDKGLTITQINPRPIENLQDKDKYYDITFV